METEQLRWLVIEPKLMEDILCLARLMNKELTSGEVLPPEEQEIMDVLRGRIAETIANKVEREGCYGLLGQDSEDGKGGTHEI